MEVQAAVVSRVEEVQPGTLFYLVGEHRGCPLCLRARFAVDDESLQQTGRIIPLQWKEEPESEGVVTFTDALPGWAASLEDARIEVDPSSFRTGSAPTRHDVFQRDGRLYFGTANSKGRVDGLVDAETGTIADTRGPIVAFTRWRITVLSDHNVRHTIAESPEAGE